MIIGAAASLLSSRSGGPRVSSATLRARFVVNAAGVGSGDIAKLVGDNSFYIKPRIGEYLLLHKKEGAKARHILFPAPGKMGKGVLVQTTCECVCVCVRVFWCTAARAHFLHCLPACAPCYTSTNTILSTPCASP